MFGLLRDNRQEFRHLLVGRRRSAVAGNQHELQPKACASIFSLVLSRRNLQRRSAIMLTPSFFNSRRPCSVRLCATIEIIVEFADILTPSMLNFLRERRIFFRNRDNFHMLAASREENESSQEKREKKKTCHSELDAKSLEKATKERRRAIPETAPQDIDMLRKTSPDFAIFS